MHTQSFIPLYKQQLPKKLLLLPAAICRWEGKRVTSPRLGLYSGISRLTQILWGHERHMERLPLPHSPSFCPGSICGWCMWLHTSSPALSPRLSPSWVRLLLCLPGLPAPSGSKQLPTCPYCLQVQGDLGSLRQGCAGPPTPDLPSLHGWKRHLAVSSSLVCLSVLCHQALVLGISREAIGA